MYINLEELRNKGWTEIIISSTNEKKLIEIASNIGKIQTHPNGELVGTIIPKNKTNAILNSFSYKYEHNTFPLHTDTAFWNVPAKYVLLFSELESQTATTIIHVQDILSILSEQQWNDVEKSIFVIKTPETSFYTKIIGKVENQLFFRFDSNCMKPINDSAKKTQKVFEEKLQLLTKNRVFWNKPKVLIFDNWKTFHGREAIIGNENRILKRIYIN